MEIIDGVELIDFFNASKNKGGDERNMRYIFHRVIHAMMQLHQAGIAHRDIKPENIMITQDY